MWVQKVLKIVFFLVLNVKFFDVLVSFYIWYKKSAIDTKLLVIVLFFLSFELFMDFGFSLLTHLGKKIIKKNCIKNC